jgi:hypothetical protein
LDMDAARCVQSVTFALRANVTKHSVVRLCGFASGVSLPARGLPSACSQNHFAVLLLGSVFGKTPCANTRRGCYGDSRRTATSWCGSPARAHSHIYCAVLLLEFCFRRNSISKTVAHVSIMGIMLTPWGAWGQAVAASGGHRNCARDWRGAEQPRRLAASGQTLGPERVSAEPRKARFSAQPKMRPNF